jgi:hypothetical protein
MNHVKVLEKAVAILERDEGIGMVSALIIAGKNIPLGTFDASHALNIHLGFPRGTWWEWQESHTHEEAIVALKGAMSVICPQSDVSGEEQHA